MTTQWVRAVARLAEDIQIPVAVNTCDFILLKIV